MPLIEDVDLYNKNNHSLDYWTGFYSNRPGFKEKVRNSFDRFRIQNKLIGFLILQKVFLDTSSYIDQTLLKNEQEIVKRGAILLHHDAITGTSNEFTMNDFY